MQQRWIWIALGLGAYAVFFLNALPAATAVRWLAPSEMRIADVEGTIWSGRAGLASLPGLPMRDLRWNIRGWPILIGRLSGRVGGRLSDGFLDTEFAAPLASLGAGPLPVRETRLSTSLASLSEVLPESVTGVAGLTSLDLEELVIEDGWPNRIIGTLRISDLEVEPFVGAGNTMIRLGSYEIAFLESSSATVSATIRDIGGPLEVNGTVSLQPSREYLLEGFLVARPDAQRELLQGLSIMLAEPDASGRRRFSFPGSL